MIPSPLICCDAFNTQIKGMSLNAQTWVEECFTAMRPLFVIPENLKFNKLIEAFLIGLTISKLTKKEIIQGKSFYIL